jgi:hypothetical protein
MDGRQGPYDVQGTMNGVPVWDTLVLDTLAAGSFRVDDDEPAVREHELVPRLGKRSQHSLFFQQQRHFKVKLLVELFRTNLFRIVEKAHGQTVQAHLILAVLVVVLGTKNDLTVFRQSHDKRGQHFLNLHNIGLPRTEIHVHLGEIPKIARVQIEFGITIPDAGRFHRKGANAAVGETRVLDLTSDQSLHVQYHYPQVGKESKIPSSLEGHETLFIVQQNASVVVEFQIQIRGIEFALVRTQPLEEPLKALGIGRSSRQVFQINRCAPFQLAIFHDAAR